ncbi:TetR family transcriptional regulator [Streptosporangiaceae bacterium NEAU-GS5]|nr:TetR family transcriptional regulator [Streptosporangiaceae bacterium NEAU-GS5]
MGGVSPGLRERKKMETRRALGFAAMRLAVERGLDNVLIDDIAAAANVSPRTFNNYFSNKYEAICALAVDRARRAGDALRERPPSEPLWEAIIAAVLAEFTGMDQVPDPQWTAGVRLVTSSPQLLGEYLKANAVMRETLTVAIADRLGLDPSREMFPGILAGAVTAAYEVACDHWLLADPPTALAPLVDQALRQLADGLPIPSSD